MFLAKNFKHGIDRLYPSGNNHWIVLANIPGSHITDLRLRILRPLKLDKSKESYKEEAEVPIVFLAKLSKMINIEQDKKATMIQCYGQC